jgi:hypothetical protein
VVFGQAVIAVARTCSSRALPELRQRLYDLIRDVFDFHEAFPDPPLLLTPAGLFL